MTIAGLHFIRPWLLLTIPAALLLLWLVYRRRGGAAGAWADQIDAALRPYVLVHGDGGHASRWPWWVAIVAVVLGATAVAGPALNQSRISAERSGDAMVIALDLSRSMDASDVAPTRLSRARLKLKDILRVRAGGETALVVFSANAFTVTPLTEDVNTIDLLVPTLTTDLMPSRGSYPESAIEKAVQLFSRSAVEQGHILLITDGGNLRPAMDAARVAREAGHKLSVLAVGTEEGSPIVLRQGGFVTDNRGNIAVPKLDPAALRRLAKAGGGNYAELSNDDSDIRELAVASRNAGREMTAIDGAELERWQDLGAWLMLPLALLASVAFRRGGFAVAAVLFYCFMPVANLQAGVWDELWRTPDQQGQHLLDEGDPAAAAKRFKRQDWQAVADYRAGNYQDSADAFSGLDGADARYNAGNALARQGEFDAAIQAYEQALELEPGHEDATYNLELLRSMRSEQSQPGDGSGDGDGEQSGQHGESDSADSAGEQADDTSEQNDRSGEGSGDGQQQEQASPADASAKSEEQRDIEALQQEFSAAEADKDALGRQQVQPMTAMEREQREQEQALEQWLRRIPDDPGGLLRRKFRSQYQRRQIDQDGNRLWPDDRSEPW